MNQTSTVPVRAATLRVPGVQLYREVRGEGPVVVLVGCPMDAPLFSPLADLLAADHTVVTTDPQGVNRSPADNPHQDVSPEMRADDLSRILAHLDAGPADVFGSSGGAVTALALAVDHPEQVRTVVAHEPPVEALLDGRDSRHAEIEDMIAAHLAGDVAGAWGKFMRHANIDLPEGETPPRAPGEPSPQAVADDRFFFEHLLRPTVWWQPDLAALRAGAARIVVGIGQASGGQICDQTSTALAAGLGIAPTLFPGGHVGFIEDPVAFAARLRAVLAG